MPQQQPQKLRSQASVLVRMPRKQVPPINSKKPLTSHQHDASSSSSLEDAPEEVQIFKQDFFDHNKAAELELKTLRKNLLDAEMNGTSLVECNTKLEAGVKRVNLNTDILKGENARLEEYWDDLLAKLTDGFNTVRTSDIANFIKDLSSEEVARKQPQAVKRARNIIAKLKL